MSQRSDTWTCQWCGKRSSREPARGQRPKWCGARCSQQAAAHRRAARLGTRVCGHCGEGFVSAEAGALYCGRVCYIATRVVPKEPRGAVQYPPTPCAWCGEVFAPTQRHAKYDSPLCKRRAKEVRARARRGEFVVPAATRARLHERDRWVCRICDLPTSRAYSPDDPLSPTLDHVIPRALTLVADDSDRNLRTVHARCNYLRGPGLRSDAEVRALVTGAISAA